MNDAIEFIVKSIHDQDVKLGDPEVLPIGARCAMCGEIITEGYPMHAVMTEATGAPLDLVHGQTDGYMSVPIARTFKLMRNVGGLLVFEDGTYYKPLISNALATEDRPTWSSLVRSIWPERQGQRMVALLSTDFKKRVWQNLRVSTLDYASLVYVYDISRDTATNLVIDWPELLRILDIVEDIYTAGFTKRAIETGLLVDYAAFSKNMVYALEKERLLQLLRSRPEFTVACIIAQKE